MKKMIGFFKVLGIDSETVDAKTEQVKNIYEKNNGVSLARARYNAYKTMDRSFRKMMKFMIESLNAEQKDNDVFFLLQVDENSLVLKNYKNTRFFKFSSNLPEFSNFCETMYYQKPHVIFSKFKLFRIEYIVKYDEANDSYDTATPEAMDYRGIEYFYGIRFSVTKK